MKTKTQTKIGEGQQLWQIFFLPSTGDRKSITLLLATAISLFLVSCQAPELIIGQRVNVERVVSGQTINIIGMADQTPILEPVRLIGIEAPDLKQEPWGTEAKQKLEELVKGHEVLLEFDVEQKDNYGRRLAYLWRDGVLLNERLVKEGYVLATTPQSRRNPSLIANVKYIRRLANAQEWARLMGRGIWNPEKPMRETPREFRKRQRTANERNP